MTFEEWKVRAYQHGTSGEMVADIVRDWEADRIVMSHEIERLRVEYGELVRLKADAIELEHYRRLKAAGGISDD